MAAHSLKKQCVKISYTPLQVLGKERGSQLLIHSDTQSKKL